jgi:outer membrane receptor protein involved in Fe transport
VAPGRDRDPLIAGGLPTQYVDVDPDETAEWVESFDNLVDTQASFTGKAWELTLFVRNLANTKGIVGGSPISSFGGARYMEYVLTRPRTVGASLRLEL